MINIDDIIKLAKDIGPKMVSVACCQDKDVLIAVENARKESIVDAILVGDIEKTKSIADELTINLNNYELIDIKDPSKACLRAVELVSDKKADMLMKGLVDTSIILKSVLNKEIGLRSGNVLSHVAVFEIQGYNKLLFITDSAMNIAPNLNTKKQIIENACSVAKALDIQKPKVSLICAKEKVDINMKDTVEAHELEEMYFRGEIKGCIVGGPFALDNAISEEAAKHKGINHPVAGKADILVVPNIEAGNILYKSISYFSKCKNAGLIVGAKAPIILTSRADSDNTKLNSIALGVLLSSRK